MKPPAETPKTAELQLMLALKNYVDALVKDAVARYGNGLQAIPPSPPISQQMRTAPTRWIYFIQGEDGGPVKIGVANNPEKRLAELQRTSPTKLVIIGQRGGDVFEEKQLHVKYAEWRLHGEWFEATEAILDEATRDEEVAA